MTSSQDSNRIYTLKEIEHNAAIIFESMNGQGVSISQEQALESSAAIAGFRSWEIAVATATPNSEVHVVYSEGDFDSYANGDVWVSIEPFRLSPLCDATHPPKTTAKLIDGEMVPSVLVVEDVSNDSAYPYINYGRVFSIAAYKRGTGGGYGGNMLVRGEAFAFFRIDDDENGENLLENITLFGNLHEAGDADWYDYLRKEYSPEPKKTELIIVVEGIYTSIDLDDKDGGFEDWVLRAIVYRQMSQYVTAGIKSVKVIMPVLREDFSSTEEFEAAISWMSSLLERLNSFMLFGGMKGILSVRHIGVDAVSALDLYADDLKISKSKVG